MFDAAPILAGLPHLPGVYRMLNAEGVAIYVGKARDLKKRVSSYFQKQTSLSPRIQLMVSQIAGIETTVVRSEAEALLLENNLIKSLSPRYNILFRDDKSYPFLTISAHKYPRLGFHRGTREGKTQYFGPFPDSGAVRESIQLLQRVFRLRTCTDSVFNNRSRPCLLYQIRRCTAPCVKLISAENYAADVRAAELFLRGKDDEAVNQLIARMNQAAEHQQYEQAALYRDQISALRQVREQQFVDSGKNDDADVLACAIEGEVVCVNLTMIRGGRHLGDRNFFPGHALGYTPAQILEAFISQHYVERDVPHVIIVRDAFDEMPALEQALATQSGHAVNIVSNPIAKRRVWLEMAEKNAGIGAAMQASLHATQENRLQALQQALHVTEAIQRIECFDISHTMGEATVASCVVYENGAMQKTQYRRFNIETAAAGDDYGAMREALSRRYSRVISGEGKMPDIVLIDGGKGQLAVAREVFSELGISDVLLVGVAKGVERKAGMEQLILPDEAPLRLGAEHPALHLIQQIRDEAHRFAISGHRARRGKVRNTSTLESIEGVGAKRRQRLITRFGGLQGLMSASIDELAKVEGISRKLAERIYEELH